MRIFILFLFTILAFEAQGQTPYAEIARMKSIVASAESRGAYQELAKAYHAKALKEFEYFARVKTAINDLSRAIDIYKTYRNLDFSRAEAHYDLANIYSYLNNYSDAKMHYEEALNLLDNSSSLQRRKKGQIIHLLANIDIINDDLESAIGKINEAFDINDDIQDSIISKLHIVTKKYLLNKKDDLIPVKMLKDEYEINSNVQEDFKNIQLLCIASIFSMEGSCNLAIPFLDRLKTNFPSDFQLIKDMEGQFANCYEILGNYELAVESYKEYILNDKQLHKKEIKTLQSRNNILSRSYEIQEENLEAQENLYQQAQRSEMQKILTYALSIGSVILLIGTYFIIRFFQEKIHTTTIIQSQKEEISKQKINELENNLKIESMHSMINGQEAERERIAQDLHDSLGGLMSTIKLHFDSIQSKNKTVKKLYEYQKANELIDIACQEIRVISNNMTPGSLAKLGLTSSITDLINRVNSPNGPNIVFQHFGIDDEIDIGLSLTIYRIIQELLNNSIKHAKASEILIEINQKEDEISLLVEDDGIGFDVGKVKRGMGTGNISSRVNYLKGELSIHSVENEGTSTMIIIPLVQEAV